tara:strand:- start:2024 stop:2203 length:180 start_codon:yes stop_codon:yes gene_type:complete
MRGDDLAKHAAAINKKGVVGNKGKNAPTKAKATKNIPDIFNNIMLCPLLDQLNINLQII